MDELAAREERDDYRDRIRGAFSELDSKVPWRGERSGEPWRLLSYREIEVLELFADRLTDKEIAARLRVIPKRSRSGPRTSAGSSAPRTAARRLRWPSRRESSGSATRKRALLVFPPFSPLPVLGRIGVRDHSDDVDDQTAIPQVASDEPAGTRRLHRRPKREGGKHEGQIRVGPHHQRQLFDGQNEKLAESMSVLVEGNRITKIAKSIAAQAGATVIDARGKVLMPGLIDAHWHMMFNLWPVGKMLSADFGYHSIVAALMAKETLLRGFTTVWDAGANCAPVKRAIDEGLVDGPRIYPSLGALSQTSGHFDYRGPNDVPEEPIAPLSHLQRVGHTIIADGVREVIKRTREVLRMGATQIKTMAGGGVVSAYDPLDVTEYTFEEAKAICDVAKTWNTYVMIHVNTDAAIYMWIKAGAKSVQHGFFIEEEAAKLMAERGVW